MGVWRPQLLEQELSDLRRGGTDGEDKPDKTPTWMKVYLDRPAPPLLTALHGHAHIVQEGGQRADGRDQDVHVHHGDQSGRQDIHRRAPVRTHREFT